MPGIVHDEEFADERHSDNIYLFAISPEVLGILGFRRLTVSDNLVIFRSDRRMNKIVLSPGSPARLPRNGGLVPAGDDPSLIRCIASEEAL